MIISYYIMLCYLMLHYVVYIISYSVVLQCSFKCMDVAAPYSFLLVPDYGMWGLFAGELGYRWSKSESCFCRASRKGGRGFTDDPSEAPIKGNVEKVPPR